MSWNLIVYKPGDTPQHNQPLGDPLEDVAEPAALRRNRSCAEPTTPRFLGVATAN
jgi:hypothetical protein